MLDLDLSDQDEIDVFANFAQELEKARTRTLEDPFPSAGLETPGTLSSTAFLLGNLDNSLIDTTYEQDDSQMEAESLGTRSDADPLYPAYADAPPAPGAAFDCSLNLSKEGLEDIDFDGNALTPLTATLVTPTKVLITKRF